MKLIPFRFGIFTMLFICIVLGCSSSNSHHQNQSGPPSIIRVGGGGGFSGYYSGTSVSSDGHIISWQKKSATAQDTILWQTTVDPDSISFFFRYLDEIDFISFNDHSNGNMNYTVEISGNKLPHSVHWGDSDPKVAPEVKVFYKMVYNYAERLQRASK